MSSVPTDEQDAERVPPDFQEYPPSVTRAVGGAVARAGLGGLAAGGFIGGFSWYMLNSIKREGGTIALADIQPGQIWLALGMPLDTMPVTLGWLMFGVFGLLGFGVVYAENRPSLPPVYQRTLGWHLVAALRSVRETGRSIAFASMLGIFAWMILLYPAMMLVGILPTWAAPAPVTWVALLLPTLAAGAYSFGLYRRSQALPDGKVAPILYPVTQR